MSYLLITGLLLLLILILTFTTTLYKLVRLKRRTKTLQKYSTDKTPFAELIRLLSAVQLSADRQIYLSNVRRQEVEDRIRSLTLELVLKQDHCDPRLDRELRRAGYPLEYVDPTRREYKLKGTAVSVPV